MAKPFISLDGPDDRGVRAEVFVEVGSGPVTAIEGLTEGKRNVRVVIEPTMLTRPVYGWLQAEDPIVAIAQQAMETGNEVRYRVESQRRSGVDREIPIQKLRENPAEASKQVSRILAGLNGTPSLEAVTNPSEDPSTSTGRIPATDMPATTTQPSPATGTLNIAEAIAVARTQRMDSAAIDVLTALAIAHGQDLPPAPHTPDTSGEVTGGTRPREEPPYALSDSDGQANAGSYAVTGALYLLNWATEQLGPIPSDADPTTIAAQHDRAQTLAGLVMGMADHVQVAVRGGGRPQRNSASHTAARRVLCALMESDGLPVGRPRTEIDAWMNRAITTAIRQYRSAIHIMQSPTADLFQAADATPPGSSSTPVTSPVTEDTMVDVPAGADPLAALDSDITPSPATEQDLLKGFVDLACAAGFAENKEPVGVWLERTWGVNSVTKLGPQDLELILEQYDGEDGPGRFHGDVMGIATAAMAFSSDTPAGR